VILLIGITFLVPKFNNTEGLCSFRQLTLVAYYYPLNYYNIIKILLFFLFCDKIPDMKSAGSKSEGKDYDRKKTFTKYDKG